MLGNLNENFFNLSKLSEIINVLELPKSSHWKWYPVTYTNRTLNPGDKWVVWDINASGWIYYFLVKCDNPLLTIKVDCYADRLNEIVTNLEELVETGNVGLGQGYFNVTKYDTTNNVYVVQYSPIFLGVPFRGRNRLVLSNPATGLAQPINVSSLYAWLIIID